MQPRDGGSNLGGIIIKGLISLTSIVQQKGEGVSIEPFHNYNVPEVILV